MCTIAGKEHWITKNKEPLKPGSFNVPLITDPSYPEWSFVLIAPQLDAIDLKDEVNKAIADGRCQKLNVEKQPYGKFRDIIVNIPQKLLPMYAFLIPVILNKGEPSVNLVSLNNFSESWAGMGKIACVSSAVHHRDRNDYLLQGTILSEIIHLGLTEAIDRVKELHKKYNLAASNLVLANKRETYVVEYLYEKISAQKVKDFAVRTNFSPKFGFWNLDWKLSSDPSRLHTMIRNVNRYLRAYHLFSNLNDKPSFDNLRTIMSDHGFYPGVSNRVDELYQMIMDGKTEEALSSLRKLDDKPSNYTICTHPSEVGKQFIKKSTTFNFTADLSNRNVEIVFGNPCFRETVIRLTL